MKTLFCSLYLFCLVFLFVCPSWSVFVFLPYIPFAYLCTFCLCPFQMFIVQKHWWNLLVLFLLLPIFKSWEFRDHVKLLNHFAMSLPLGLSLYMKSAFCHWKVSLLLEDFKHLLVLHLLLKARQVQSWFLVFASSSSAIFLAVGINVIAVEE